MYVYIEDMWMDLGGEVEVGCIFIRRGKFIVFEGVG